MHRPDGNDGDVTAIGRHGTLELTFARQGTETRVTHSRSRSPWHFFPPMSLDGGIAYVMLVNPSGGLVGGDRVAVRMTLGAGAHVLCSTPSANRVYRSDSSSAEQDIHLHVGPGAILEWVPDLTIPYEHAMFSQSVQVRLKESASLIFWDGMAAGRIARGERWAFARFGNEVRIQTPDGSLVERYALIPRSGGNAVGLVQEWGYIATLYILSDAVGEETWKRLEEMIAEALENRQGRVLGGVSEPAVRGLIVKLLAKSAPDLNSVFETVWTAARAQLWGLPFPALRRY